MQILEKYFPLDPIQRQQFAQLQSLYAEWNERINVVSRKDIDNLYEKHVLHSLAIAKLIRFAPGTQVIDVGTGGGFPGIPLAIFCPQASFTLVDSIGKKIKVVQAVAEALGLHNVEAMQMRSNELQRKADFVVSRAVADLSKFVADTRHLIHRKDKHGLPNGILYLKGGDLTAELAPWGRRAEVFELSGFFDEPFFDTKRLVYLPATAL